MRRFLNWKNENGNYSCPCWSFYGAVALTERGFLPVAGRAVTGQAGKRLVIVDAGHGGNDPGKIGVDDSKEKEINLQIAKN